MSTATLTNLRDYLTGTLSPADMVWLGQELTEYAKKKEEDLPQRYTKEDVNAMHDDAESEIAAGSGIPVTQPTYTMEELNARIDESERQIAAGECSTTDEVFRKLYGKYRTKGLSVA